MLVYCWIPRKTIQRKYHPVTYWLRPHVSIQWCTINSPINYRYPMYLRTWVRNHTRCSQAIRSPSRHIGMLQSTTRHLLVSYGRSLPLLWWETVEQLHVFRFGVTRGFLVVLHRLFSRRIWLLLDAFFQILLITTTYSVGAAGIWEIRVSPQTGGSQIQDNSFKNNVAQNMLVRNLQIFSKYPLSQPTPTSWLELPSKGSIPCTLAHVTL